MSTLVMAERDGELCMAAETLTSFGSMKRSARYVAHPEKILRVGESYVGLIGWSSMHTVLWSLFEGDCALPEVRSELELFEFSRTLHRRLKDDYFLRSREDRNDPVESSHLTMFVMNRHGLFSLYSLRSVDRCQRFAAVGSGSDYALGAMHAAYELGQSAEQVAQCGVEAAVEFDKSSLGPITLEKLKLDGSGS